MSTRYTENEQREALREIEKLLRKARDIADEYKVMFEGYEPPGATMDSDGEPMWQDSGCTIGQEDGDDDDGWESSSC